MLGTLTTFGMGVPRYSREAFCQVDPIVFVQLEAQSLASEGRVTAVFSGEDGRVYRGEAEPIGVDANGLS